MQYAKFHDELAEAMSPYRGRTFQNKDIVGLFEEAYPHLNSGWVQPLDHCVDHTCKGACACAGTEKTIFSRPKYITYVLL